MIQPQAEYSISYTPPSSSTAVGVGSDGAVNEDNIVIPSQATTSAATSALPRSSASTATTTNTNNHTTNNKGNDDNGVVITPDPTGIVIKTRLMKGNRQQQASHQFSLNNNNANESYVVPASLSSMYASTGHDDTTANNTTTQDDDTKIFLNICTHPIIAIPGQRKGLDDQTGEEVDGWRLPMSMGELRPCYDKGGNAAIVVDCILNPNVIREMNADSNHFHFVCDLVVQCASRKFGQTWFGGHELDRRFKLPKMKYAGSVDEATGLPLLPPNDDSNEDGGSSEGVRTKQKPSVAKQRVKGHGGNTSPIIQEVVESSSSNSCRPVVEHEVKNKTEFHIELCIHTSADSDGEQQCIPLFDFLAMAAEDQNDGVAHQGQGQQSASTLREMIKCPQLKTCDDNDDLVLHKSQLLVTPMPFDITGAVEKTRDGDESDTTNWSILAKCTLQSQQPSISVQRATPEVDVSAFLLVISTDNNVKTECILPFPVDTHKTTSTYNTSTGVLEITMPLLLHSSLYDGPDIGTKQWKIQTAFGSGGEKNKRSARKVVEGDASKDKTNNSGSYFCDTNNFNNDENGNHDNDDMQTLPEDAFHAQDVLSRHILQQQENECNARREKNDHIGREGADVEYI